MMAAIQVCGRRSRKFLKYFTHCHPLSLLRAAIDDALQLG